MNPVSARLMIALIDGVVCVKVAGRANFTCSVDLKKVLHELSQHGHHQFVIDLSECTMMDSTFLGVLAGVASQFAPGSETTASVQLMNPTDRVTELLENVGVMRLFKITRANAPSTESFSPVTAQGNETTQVEVTRTCLEAHQTLMKLNPENIRKFKDVAQFLAEDLKRFESGQK